MLSSPRAPADVQEPLADSDGIDCPALLDLEGNFVSSFISEPAPAEPHNASPYPYAAYQLDSSRLLTRLTQRLALDVHIRKQGHDAYASSSSDADGESGGALQRAAKAATRLHNAKDAKAPGKASAIPAPARDARIDAVDGRQRAKVKKFLTSSIDDEELDGFVVDDNAEVSEYRLPARAQSKKHRPDGLNRVVSSDGDDFANDFSSSRAAAAALLNSSTSGSESDDVLDLTLSRNRGRSAKFQPQVQTKLNFASSKASSSTASRTTAPIREQPAAAAAAADSRESFDAHQKLTFCALTDVKPTRVFTEQHARSWPRLRVAAWQSRLNDIHRYMMHLPFPHDGIATTLHLNQQWARSESDRLLDIIDKCIQSGVCVNRNWSYIAFLLRCRTGHQCSIHFNNLIVDGHVPQSKYSLCCQGVANTLAGDEDWAVQLKQKWEDALICSLQASIDRVLIDVTAARGSKSKETQNPESSSQLALRKDYASKMLKIQVQALRFVPLPRMPPIQIIPPDFPHYSFASEKNKVRRQDTSRRETSENIQIFQPGTAAKGAPHNAVKTQGDRGKVQGQRRSNPTTLREANEAQNENGIDLDDQDFSRSLSSHSTGTANSSAQSGIVLVMREFMGCHTLDIINMAAPQGSQSDSEDAGSDGMLADPKTLLLKEVKLIHSFFDSFASADAEARAKSLESEGSLLVGSCKSIYLASRSIVADDAALVRQDVNHLALCVCDVLCDFSSNPKFCFALNFLLKALVKLRTVTAQLLDNVLMVCICLAQDAPVLVEQCSSPADLLFSKAYIQLFITTASAFSGQQPGLWASLSKLFGTISDRLSTVSFEWFWEVMCVGVGCMRRLQMQQDGENTKLLTALFSKLVAVTCKEFNVIQSTYSVHRANTFAITMMERMIFLLEFCGSDTKACASVIGFACITCFQCKADAHLFIDDCCRNLSANLPWESLRGQLLQRPCAAFSILFEKLESIPSMLQKQERTRANLFLSITLEALKNQKPKYMDAVKANFFGATRECRHVLRLICKKKAFILKQGSGILHSGCTNCCMEILEFFDISEVPIAIFSDAMAALQLFMDPLIRSFPPDATFQDHEVIKKLLEVLPQFRGNSDGHTGDGRFGIEFRTKVSCFVVSVLKDFCAADCCLTEGLGVVTQLLDFVHLNIRNLFVESNRLSNSNQEHSYTLANIPQLEFALSDLCATTSSLCVCSDDASNVIANKIFVSRAIIVTVFKCMFEGGTRLPCSMIKCCVAAFHRLITGHCMVLDKLEETERAIQSLHDELQNLEVHIAVTNASDDSNSDENMAVISSLIERKHFVKQESAKEESVKVVLADSLRRACAQFPDSLIWHLHGLILNRYTDSTQDKRDPRFRVSEELSQLCMRSFSLEWRVRAQMDAHFKTNHSPWQVWFKFFGPESTSITIISGMRLKEGQYTTAATAQRLIPLHAALFMADAASGVVATHPEQFLRVWLLFALDVKCPKQEKRSLFDSLFKAIFPQIPLQSMLSAPSHEFVDDCSIVCSQLSYLSQALPSLAKAKAIVASFCGFFESALQFGLGCLLLVPQYIRDQQLELARYFCSIAALLCKLFWRDLMAIPSIQNKQVSALNFIISELFILPPKFLHDSSGVQQVLEDLVLCCLSWAEVDHDSAIGTLHQIVRAQLQFLVSASGLPSRPQSAVEYIVHVLCKAASTSNSSHISVVETLHHLARSAALQMTRDIRCLCFHVIAACLCQLLDAYSKQHSDVLFDNKSAEFAAIACCQTFVELVQELSNGADSNFTEALAELRTCISQMCQIRWPSSAPPAWLVLMVRFTSCTLLQELIAIVPPRESNVTNDLCLQLLCRRVDACQSACLPQILRDLGASINKPKTLHMSHHATNFLMFLTSLCDSAPHAFLCDMQVAASYIASRFSESDADGACVIGQMLSVVCIRHGFASASI